MALHFALVGLGLLFFGPEGVRTEPLTSLSTEFAGVLISGQTMLIVIAALVFSGLLYLFFDFTLVGKSLRATAVNRTGSRLMGIRPARAGTIAYLLGSLMAGVSGILIAPVNTVFYDSGFLIGLKAFVGAIVGGMTSYPGAAIGAVGVGILESFASFESSALKDVIVFSLADPDPDLAIPRLAAFRGGDRGMTRLHIQLAAVLAVLCLAVAPFVLSPFSITLMNYIGIYSLVAIGLALLTGVGGIVSFGQAAFVGVAAYATAWVSALNGYSPWLGLVFGVVLTCGVATVLGVVTLRLQGHFLSLSTVAWGLAIGFLFGNVEGLGRFNGISSIPPISFGSIALVTSAQIYFLIWGIVAAVLFLGYNLLDSRLGRAMRVLRGGNTLVESLGINAFRIKLVTFVIAAFLASLSGWLYAHMSRFI